VRRQPTSGPSSRDQRSGQFASGAGGRRHGLYFRSDIFSGICQVNLAYGGCALLLLMLQPADGLFATWQSDPAPNPLGNVAWSPHYRPAIQRSGKHPFAPIPTTHASELEIREL